MNTLDFCPHLAGIRAAAHRWALALIWFVGFPSGTVVKNPLASSCRRCKRCRFDPWVGKIPWSRKWQPIPVFLPGKFHRQRSLAGYSPWGQRESDATEHACTIWIIETWVLSWGCHQAAAVGSNFGQPCVTIPVWLSFLRRPSLEGYCEE